MYNESFNKLINNPDFKNIQSFSEKFNLFKVLKLEDYEIRHSNFLAWIMRPKESHGIGDKFINILLNKFLPHLQSYDNFSEIEVEREKDNIDLLIKDYEKKFIVLIENKIKAKLNVAQLKKYKNKIESSKEYNNFNKYYFFLTPYELHDEQRHEINKISYKIIEYNSICQILKSVIDFVLEPKAYAFIQQYIEMLEMNHLQNSEYQESCKKIYKNNKDIIDEIIKVNQILEETIFYESMEEKGIPLEVIDKIKGIQAWIEKHGTILWMTRHGQKVKTFNFIYEINKNKYNIFQIDNTAKIRINYGWLYDKNVSRDKQIILHNQLREINFFKKNDVLDNIEEKRNFKGKTIKNIDDFSIDQFLDAIDIFSKNNLK